MVRRCVYCYITKQKINLKKLLWLQENTMAFSTKHPFISFTNKHSYAYRLKIIYWVCLNSSTVIMFNQLENANINKIGNFLQENYWLQIFRVSARDLRLSCLIFTAHSSHLLSSSPSLFLVFTLKFMFVCVRTRAISKMFGCMKCIERKLSFVFLCRVCLRFI